MYNEKKIKRCLLCCWSRAEHVYIIVQVRWYVNSSTAKEAFVVGPVTWKTRYIVMNLVTGIFDCFPFW